MASLEEELGIPMDASLVIPTTLPGPIRLSFAPLHSLPSLTLSNPIQRSQSDVGVSISTVVSPASSSRNYDAAAATAPPRCLIVGRQASASDVRIDHKSISRRHAALYYTTTRSSFVVHDLGGKFGTFVDGTRLDMYGRRYLPLRRRGGGGGGTTNDDDDIHNIRHEIRFGNSPLICRVTCNLTAADEKAESSGSIPPSMMMMNAIDIGDESRIGGNDDDVDVTTTADHQTQDDETAHDKAAADNKTNDDTTVITNNNTDESTREAREVQIAAMIASLESDPVYEKYIIPTTNGEEGENSTIVTTTTTSTTKLVTTDIRKNGLPTNTSDATRSNVNGTDPNNVYNLPISSYITLAPSSDSFASSDGSGNSIQAKASVSALCFEPSGARLVAGHRDGSLRFYDFHGMRPTSSANSSSDSPCDDTPFPPFRVVDSDTDRLDSTGRHVITSLGASCVGGDGQWIVGTTSAQPHVLDREGKSTLHHFIKGDMYVTDADRNRGHTAPVTGVGYHPLIPDIAWSCGYDGSIRQWDLSGKGKLQFHKLVCQRVIGKCKNEKGQRTQIVSNISVHPGGRKIVVGTSCGSIQIWNTFGSNNGAVNSTRPLGAVYSAHGGDSSNNKPVTFVTFNGDGSRIASRSELDDTVRIWDVNTMENGTVLGGKKFKKGGEHPPSLLLATCIGLPALNESATCAFGPDGRIVCAGTSVEPRAGMSASGKLKFYRLPDVDKRSNKISGGREEMNSKASSKNNVTTATLLEPIMELNVAPGASVLGVQWHPKLNQIALGTSNGIIRVLYDPICSTKGALLPTSRSVRKSDGLSELLRSRAPTGSAAYLTSSATSSIITPNSLPMFRDAPKATRKTREDERNDPEKTKLPQPPVTGGMRTGGALGGGLNFAQHVKKSANYGNNKNIAGKDPREELFKYNEGKSYVSQAYEGNIQKILAEKTVEEEEAELKLGGSSKRQKTK